MGGLFWLSLAICRKRGEVTKAPVESALEASNAPASGLTEPLTLLPYRVTSVDSVLCDSLKHCKCQSSRLQVVSQVQQFELCPSSCCPPSQSLCHGMEEKMLFTNDTTNDLLGVWGCLLPVGNIAL